MKPRRILCSAVTAKSSATSWQIGNNLHVGFDAVAATRTKIILNISSTSACCNCRLVEGKKAHPTNCLGWRHAKEEMQKRNSLRTSKTTSRRVFSSNVSTSDISFLVALRANTKQQQRPQVVVRPNTKEQRVLVPLFQHKH